MQKPFYGATGRQGAGDFVSVSGVSKNFGTTIALQEISLMVRQGETFGLIGSDGAGKTTLLRVITTLLTPDAGTVRIDGLDAHNGRQRQEIKRIIGYMPQRFGLYPDLSVEENFNFFLDIFGVGGSERRRRRDLYLGFSNLLPFTKRRAKDLSGGMRQKLGLACVLVHEPSLLILDEPTNGVDPVSRQEFWEILEMMKERGMTTVVSSAYTEEAYRCDRVALMHQSRIVVCDTPTTIATGYGDLEDALVSRIAATQKQ